MSRMAWAEARFVDEEMAMLQGQLNALKSPEEKDAEQKAKRMAVDRTWEDMRRKGRG